MSDNDQVIKLMRILYEIYLGNEKDYFFSSKIYQIYSDFLISCLKETFENNNPYYEIEDVKHLSRTREKP